MIGATSGDLQVALRRSCDVHVVRLLSVFLPDLVSRRLSYFPHHYQALNSLICADVPLRNCLLIHSSLGDRCEAAC